MSFDSILQVLDEILYQSERILVRKLETPFYGDRANQPIPSVPDEIEKKSFHQKVRMQIAPNFGGWFYFPALLR